MPNPISVPEVVEPPVEPALLRIGTDATLLDTPWGLVGSTVANVWRDDASAGGWARVPWPIAPGTTRLVVPVDLHLGHVLEVAAWRGGTWSAVYGWVADVDTRRIILVPSVSAPAAVGAARRAVDVWRAAELGAIEERWRARFDDARRFTAGPA